MMNFINSILLFFALLLLGPKLLSSIESMPSKSIELSKKEKGPYADMVLVRGGTFSMGLDEESVLNEWNNSIRRVTVNTFRIDQYEVSNKKYRTFSNWYRDVIKNDSMWKFTLPDTNLWKTDLAFYDPMAESYFRYPAFNDYPVVGVTWDQATFYCRWRTDRANEPALKANNLIDQKQPYLGKAQISYALADSAKKRRRNLDDFVLIPDFRLPTEAEWEYAAKLAVQKPGADGSGAAKSGVHSRTRGASLTPLDSYYPWASTGNESIRYGANGKGSDRGVEGMFKANYKNGSGDYMGMIGSPNDGNGLPAKVNKYNQSPLNIYNIRGNVNEWVLDMYRPLSNLDVEDFNPYRKSSVLDGEDPRESIYQTGENTLISDKSRVYKGGSWKDPIYWLNPGTRRFMDQDKTNTTLGFRCVISAFGMDDAKSMNDGRPKFFSMPHFSNPFSRNKQGDSTKKK